MPQRGYNHRRQFSSTCQKIALSQFYPNYFPPQFYRVIEVDELPGDLAKTLDIGGIDKVIVHRLDGHLILLSHRFREASVWNNPMHRDFTIREAEWDRHIKALENGGTIPNYYGYGYANNNRLNADKIDGFLQFYLLDYKTWLNDVCHHKTRAPYFKDNNGKQENFYWIKWSTMPEHYLVNATMQVLQPRLI